MPDTQPAAADTLSFEKALAEAIAIYERGEALKKRCEQLLGEAEARVEKIRLGAGGRPEGTEPLDQV